jgi:hypothetical protein
MKQKSAPEIESPSALSENSPNFMEVEFSLPFSELLSRCIQNFEVVLTFSECNFLGNRSLKASSQGAVIAQSVQRLATGWTIRGTGVRDLIG